MLDLGWERHQILHRLMDVTDRHDGDADALRAALRALRHNRPEN
jgi:hypothetical protein